MKNLILYGTTYGYTEKCARQLADKLDGTTDCVNVANAGELDLDRYDTLVIGSSVYMGQMNKKIKQLFSAYKDAMKNKRLGFFVCCGFPEMAEKHFENNVPGELLAKAVAKECFGGLMEPAKMGFMHKFITNMVKKAGEKEGRKDSEPMPENIDKMAKVLNAVKGA